MHIACWLHVIETS